MSNLLIRRRIVVITFVAIFIALQYSLWNGKQNVFDLYRSKEQLNELRTNNQKYRARNDRLHEDVIDIKNRASAIESQARYDLGLIKPGETYYQIVRPDAH